MNDIEVRDLYEQVQKMEDRLKHIEDICQGEEDGQEKNTS
jgi:hypothetical protein